MHTLSPDAALPLSTRRTALAPLKSRALLDGKARVARKRGIPCGPRAPDVGGAPPGLVELDMPADSTQPEFRAKLQPRGVRRLVRLRCRIWPRLPRA